MSRGASPFRFEIMWLRVEGFKDLLKNWWQSLCFNGTFKFFIASTLKALKALLKTWNMDIFGRVEVDKCKALQRVNFWDDLEKDRSLSLEDFEAKFGKRRFQVLVPVGGSFLETKIQRVVAKGRG